LPVLTPTPVEHIAKGIAKNTAIPANLVKGYGSRTLYATRHHFSLVLCDASRPWAL